MKEQTDRQLVESAKQGNPEAAAELYRRYWRAARAVAYGITADFAAAEDAAAEGLHAAFVSLQKLKNPERLAPWLRTIVVRAARRQRPRHANWEDLTTFPEEVSSLSQIEHRELASLVREAVGGLPGRLREAISLHYFEGYPVAEAAHFLGIPTGTFKRRLHEGRGRLKDSCTAILHGRKPMNSDCVRLAKRIDAMLTEGADKTMFVELAQEAMQLRPVPHDLVQKLYKALFASQFTGKKKEETRGRIHQALQEHGRPSARTADPNHAVGRAAQGIIEALPRFQRWEIPPERIVDFMTDRFGPDGPPEKECLLAPGFVEGRSGSYLRLTSGLVIVDEQGHLQDVGTLLRKSISRKTAKSQPDSNAKLSDVIDLSWMETRPLELREVESQLRELAHKVVGGVAVRFSVCEEPRYRAALHMYLGDCANSGDCANPAATGGVLQEWPGMVEGTSAAHVRIYLETWASVMSGTQVEFRSFPWPTLDSSEGPFPDDN